MFVNPRFGSSVDELPTAPGYLLHSLDLNEDRALFYPTSRKLLGDASFVDWRSPIATAAPIAARFSNLLHARWPDRSPPDRFIFHISFCGSTFLSRLLDRSGRSLVLKEPNCLANLATHKTLCVRGGQSDPKLEPALRFSRAALFRRWSAKEPVTVKPSSWINVLLEDIVADPRDILPIFIVMDRSAFLRAVFRGGRPRLVYTAELAWHCAAHVKDGGTLIKAAIEAADEPMGRAANLALLAHHLQFAWFEQALEKGGWGSGHVLDFEDILAAPFDAARKASQALLLDLNTRDLERNVGVQTKRHSKAPEFSFSESSLKDADEIVTECHRDVLDDALKWSEKMFGRQRPLGSINGKTCTPLRARDARAS